MFWFGVGALVIGGCLAWTLDRWIGNGPPELPVAIASAGEWVTHPDGTRVCRLRYGIFRGQVMEPGDCEDWQERIPFHGQQVDFLRWTAFGGGKINIEGKWRP